MLTRSMRQRTNDASDLSLPSPGYICRTRVVFIGALAIKAGEEVLTLAWMVWRNFFMVIFLNLGVLEKVPKDARAMPK